MSTGIIAIAAALAIAISTIGPGIGQVLPPPTPWTPSRASPRPPAPSART